MSLPQPLLLTPAGVQGCSGGGNNSEGLVRGRHRRGVERVAACGLGPPGASVCHGCQRAARPKCHLPAA